MKKLICILVMVGVFATSFGSPVRVNAQSPWPLVCQESSLPSHDPKYPDDQLVVTCIPPNWNGALVIYAHGYVPIQFALALPTSELTLPDGTFVPEIILSLGYAFATTSYHKNGYAVEQAQKDLNNLLAYFRSLAPHDMLQKVYLVGASEGGEITAMMIERFPGKYNGGLAMCGPIGGAPYQVQYMSDFMVLFNYFFPGVFPFGLTDVPVDSYQAWENYTQTIAIAMMSNSDGVFQLSNVSGAAVDPLDPLSSISTAVSILFYSIWGTNDLISTAGGIPYDNQSTVYSGSFNDLLLNAQVERVQSSMRAVAYLQRYYQTTGLLQRPLVTLHNTLDPVVPFHHEEIYTSLATGTGSANFLTVLPVPRYGHCNFTLEEVMYAFALLVTQSESQAEP